MKTQSVQRKSIALLLTGLTAGLILGASLLVFVRSPTGQMIGADTWLDIGQSLTFIGVFVFLLKSNWRKWGLLRKAFIGVMIIMAALVLAMSLYTKWPRSPWGRAGVFQSANDFMSDLHSANYPAAVAKLSPVTQRDVGLSGLRPVPNAQPVSWEFIGMEGYSTITGTAIFTDGVELPITVKLRWHAARWQIYGVTFGEANDIRVDFLACCDSGW